MSCHPLLHCLCIFFFFTVSFPAEKLSGLLSELQEKAQKIYFHMWSITANTLKLCLIFIKRNFIRICFGIISIVTDTETEMEKENKEAQMREREDIKEKGREGE
ncbi:hypothetical protein AMECASPLE_018891 [Ameca splendens]|uniref:Secreted protein n=1 Tax=Ameca splendens TaxID=208324 RepID=A0ABV0ZZK5_9TELE